MAVLTLSKIKCRSCGDARDSCIETSFAFTTSIPPLKSGDSTVGLTEWFVFPQPIIALFQSNGSPETLSWDSHASPQKHSADLEKYNSLGAYSEPDRIQSSCDECSKLTDAVKWMEFKQLSSYALVNINRVKAYDSQDTSTMTVR